MGKSQTRYPHQLAVKVSPKMFALINTAMERSGLKRVDWLRTTLHNALLREQPTRKGETQ